MRDIAKANNLRAGAGTRHQCLHLLRGEVLRFIEDDIAIEEGSTAHEIQRTNLDAIAEQIIRRRSSPAAAIGALGQHL